MECPHRRHHARTSPKTMSGMPETLSCDFKSVPPVTVGSVTPTVFGKTPAVDALAVPFDPPRPPGIGRIDPSVVAQPGCGLVTL